MSVSKVLNAGRIIWQTSAEIPNPALLVHVDNGGTLVLEQEGREICIDWETIEELVRALREKAKERSTAGQK